MPTSARQNAPFLRKPAANPMVPWRADVGIGPYNSEGRYCKSQTANLVCGLGFLLRHYLLQYSSAVSMTGCADRSIRAASRRVSGAS